MHPGVDPHISEEAMKYVELAERVAAVLAPDDAEAGV
jgi:hypothetical protein